MKPENDNLREALRLAQESLEKCDVFYGESNDDSCRYLYGRIKEMLQEQQSLLAREIQLHKEQGQWEQ